MLIDPDGKNEKKVDRGSAGRTTLAAQLSPDGKMLAVLILDDCPNDGTRQERVPRALTSAGWRRRNRARASASQCQMFAWSPDGTEIACSDFEDGQVEKEPDVTHCIVNVKTKEKTAREAAGRPRDHRLVARRQVLPHDLRSTVHERSSRRCGST